MGNSLTDMSKGRTIITNERDNCALLKSKVNIDSG